MVEKDGMSIGERRMLYGAVKIPHIISYKLQVLKMRDTLSLLCSV